MYIGVRWACSDPAEHQTFQAEGIGGAEDRAHVVHATHIVQHDEDG